MNPDPDRADESAAAGRSLGADAHDSVPVQSPAPLRGFVAGAAAVVVGLVGAAAAGGPYLSFDEVNWWIVLFAIGLFAMLFAAPFAIQATLFAEIRESERRWERAVLAWAALTFAVAAVFCLIGLIGSFDTDGLGGAVAVAGLVETGIVLGVVAVTMIEG